MPAAIPIIASFAAAAGSVGAVIAGTATLAEFATVAGAVLTGVGALTGEKDLMKVGGLLTLGGGIGQALGGAASGVSGAEGFEGASSSAAPAAAEAGAAGGAVTEAGATAATAPTTVAPSMVPDDYGNAMTVGGGGDANPNSIMSRASAAAPPQAAPGAGTGTAGQLATAPQSPAMVTPPTPVQPTITTGPLADAAKGVTSGDLNSWWQRAQKMGSGVLDFMQKNPNLMKVGGDMLTAMYGPNAEAIDFQKGIYNRQVANLNSPVRITFNPTQGGK